MEGTVKRTVPKINHHPDPECQHPKAEALVINGLLTGRVTDNKPIWFCPDCGKVGADIRPKDTNGKD